MGLFSTISADESNSLGRIDNTVLSSDYVKPTVGGRKHFLLWRMPNGYVKCAFSDVRVKPVGLTGTASSDEDAAFIIPGPICLVAMTFDNKYKMMASGWARRIDA